MTPEISILTTLWNFLQAAGLPGGMAFFILCLYKKWIRFGYQYDELQKVVDKYEALASAALEQATAALREGRPK